jgi:hypothetical protein
VNRTILLAIGGLAVGLALAASGSLLLGAARAVAKHTAHDKRRLGADLKQYAAALCALAGFLLTAGGGALLLRELVPLDDPVRTVTAAGVGVLLFAAAGFIFSRTADFAEDARTRKIPATGYEATGYEPLDPATAAAQTGPAEDADELAASGSAIPDGATLLRGVRPGWIYRDGAETWYLGVADLHTGALPLLRLPEFALVAVEEPAYPLIVAGAGEIAVVPLPAAPDEGTRTSD